MTKIQTLSLVFLLIYFVLIVYTVIKTSKNKDEKDYFLAGRQLPFWALSITFIASWWGAGSAIETVDQAFDDGISAFWIYGMPVLFSTFLMYIFSKGIRRIGTLTQPQLLKQRYNHSSSIILSLLVFLFMTITAASQMVGVGIFFESFLGWDYSWSIVIGSVIVLTYSFFGGFRGVVITDIIQFVFLLLAALIVFYFAWDHSGGFTEIWTTQKEVETPDYYDFFSGIQNNMIYVVTFGCAWMIQANIWQRISACRSAGDSRRMIGLSFLVFAPLYMMVTLTGMLSSGIYDTIPEGGIIANIVKDFMPPVLGALIFLGISSAIMSTMDSLINTGALVLTLDIYPEILPKSLMKKKVLLGRISTLLITLIGIYISLEIKSILKVSWIAADFLATGAFTPLVLGFIWKRGNAKGAIVSMIFGILYSSYNLLISLNIDLPSFWEQGSPTQVLLGMGGSAFLFITTSLMTKGEGRKAQKFITKAGLYKLRA